MFGHKPLTRRSFINYPGGKSHAKKIIRSYFPKGIKEMVSPFCGGCHIELDCAADEIKVYAYDLYKELVNFWQQMSLNKPELQTHAKNFIPVDKDRFMQVFEEYKSYSPTKKAVAFLLLHRCSYRGRAFSDKSRWFFPGHYFRDSVVKTIADYYNPYLVVKCADFEHALAKHKDLFAYLDPPYMIEYSSNLYGNKGELHAAFDHDRLCKVLRSRQTPWVLSYNNCQAIRQMYKGYRFEYPKWTQTFSGKSSKGNEILIINSVAYDLV